MMLTNEEILALLPDGLTGHIGQDILTVKNPEHPLHLVDVMVTEYARSLPALDFKARIIAPAIDALHERATRV